jgi:5'-methylthioadenosine phosphorylase
MESDVRVGIIGGSGLYQMEGLTDIQEIEIQTPLGTHPIVTGSVHLKGSASFSCTP